MTNDINYQIDYDDSFVDQVKCNGTNPLLDIRIEIGGEDIKGAPEGEAYIDDYIGMHIIKLLDSIPKLQRGETVEFTFYSHSQVLFMNPENGKITLACVPPVKLEDMSPEEKFTVDKKAFVREVIRTADEFVSKLLGVNEGFADEDRVQEIVKRTDQIESEN